MHGQASATRYGILIMALTAGCLLLGLTAPLKAEEGKKRSILLWDISASGGVTPENAELIFELVAADLSRRDIKIITRTAINQSLSLMENRQQCGGDEVSCVAEIGNAMGIREALFGRVGLLGSTWVLTLQVVDVMKVEIRRSSSRTIRGDIDDLVPMIPLMVDELLYDAAPALVSPPPPPPPTTGTVIITSTPAGAAVSVDGTAAGVAPLTLELEKGPHEVALNLPDYEPQRQSVEVAAGQASELTFAMKPMPLPRLLISVTPSQAILYLDGKEIGAGTVEVETEPGEHTIEAKALGFQAKGTVVKSVRGERYPVSLTLARLVIKNPYSRIGHGLFWPGLIVAGGGGALTYMALHEADAHASSLDGDKDLNRLYSSLAVTAYCVGGAMMVTGIVMWAMAPGYRKKIERQSLGLGVVPLHNGGAVGVVTGRW